MDPGEEAESVLDLQPGIRGSLVCRVPNKGLEAAPGSSETKPEASPLKRSKSKDSEDETGVRILDESDGWDEIKKPKPKVRKVMPEKRKKGKGKGKGKGKCKSNSAAL